MRDLVSTTICPSKYANSQLGCCKRHITQRASCRYDVVSQVGRPGSILPQSPSWLSKPGRDKKTMNKPPSQAVILQLLMTRSIGLELQVLTLRRLLERKNVITDEEYKDLIARFRDTYRDHLSGLARLEDGESLSDLLQNFDGPSQ